MYWLSALSGVLLTLSFAPYGLDVLAWVALMPVAHAALKDPSRAFRLGFVFGLVFFWWSVQWLRHVTVAGWLALGVYLALFFAVWTWGLARFRAGFPAVSGAHHLLVSAFGAASWVALEWLRGWIMTGFPWNFVSASQYKNIALIQIAELTGAYGVTFLVVFFNLAFLLGGVRMFQEKFSMRSWRYELTVALLLIAATLVYGMRSFMRVAQADPPAQIKVALIQPNLPQTLKWVEAEELKNWEDLGRLTLQAAALQPDLIIWPETALTSGPSFDQRAADFLDRIAREAKAPLIVGTIDSDPRVRLHYNAALLVDSRAAAGAPYRKRHLVPFGEFVPFDKRFPILRKLTPIGASFGTGIGPQLFDFQQGRIKLGMLICFEDTLPYLARESVAAGADILVNVTNDGWFLESGEQVQHAASAVYRSVENRVSLVRCCNNGLSCVIEPTGQISSALEDKERGIYVRGLNTATVRVLRAPRTFYNRYGDVFALTCLALSAIAWTSWLAQFLISRKAAKAQRISS